MWNAVHYTSVKNVSSNFVSNSTGIVKQNLIMLRFQNINYYNQHQFRNINSFVIWILLYTVHKKYKYSNQTCSIKYCYLSKIDKMYSIQYTAVDLLLTRAWMCFLKKHDMHFFFNHFILETANCITFVITTQIYACLIFCDFSNRDYNVQLQIMELLKTSLEKSEARVFSNTCKIKIPSKQNMN